MERHHDIDNGKQRGPSSVNRNIKLKCLQVNIQHSRVDASNLTQVILQHNVDIALLQELCTLHNKVAGFPTGLKIFTHGGGRKRAAIILNNNEIDVLLLHKARTRNQS